MPRKHANAMRLGGAGASHENKKHPEKSKPRNQPPTARHPRRASEVSGGGGEPDRRHAHAPSRKSQ